MARGHSRRGDAMLHSSSEYRQKENRTLQIWYRHSGEEEIQRIPYTPTYRTFQDEGEITSNIGNHHITHMAIGNGVIPQLDVIAPNLTHLMIREVDQFSQLQCLCLLTQLRVLDLSKNNFSVGIPTVIEEIHTLNELYLSKCNLNSLPVSLSQLTQLRVLALYHNNFSAGLPEVIAEIHSLNELYLNNCNLTVLPESLSWLTQLKVLDLSNNIFSAGIPAVIGEINRLNELNLLYCHVTSLPESLSQLTQLKVLDLSSNNFSSGIPAVIGEINSLHELNLNNCNLTFLPTSLSQLTQLRALDLSNNNFSAGLPAVIGKFNCLDKLYLDSCQLSDLPDRLHGWEKLEVLSLRNNQFEHLPPVIFHLAELKALYLDNNKKLVRIDDDFMILTKLIDLNCTSCHSLAFPPYAVCEQGLTAVKTFFNGIKRAKEVEMTVVPVAIIGQSMSGKSSLVRSLRTGQRSLTCREANSPLDETTKVFQVEQLQLSSSQLKLIDFGGNDVYNIAFRIMIKEQYLPLVVVNLEEFSILSLSVGSKEATRKVCLDWLSHCYLACPRLGRPILAITHVDKLSSEDVKSCVKELLEQAEVIRQGVLDEERVHHGSFQEIVHLSNTQIPLFAPEDIFEFSNDITTTSNIQSLMDNLEERSREFTVIIPRMWEELASFIHDLSDTPYISISDITSKFSGEDCLVILRYMHNIGDILWFESIDGLSAYLFHQLPAITEMITVLFHHCAKDQWNTRLAKFIPFYRGNQWIDKERYLNLIEDFIISGIIAKALLFHLLETESKFPPELALELLKCFCIVHGPVETKNGDGYIIPSFAPIPKDDVWNVDGFLQLRLDIILGGLTLPRYVHQLITVAVLNQALSLTATFEVAKNGAAVHHGASTTHLVHDFDGRMVTLQISTPVEQLGDSWKRLMDTAEQVFILLSQIWKACRASFKFYCSHCLFLKDPNPDFDVDPSWFRPILDRTKSGISVCTESFQGLQPVICSTVAVRSKSLRPSVPKPLKFPCFQLTEEETQQLKSYLLNESTCYYSASAAIGADGETELTLESKMEQSREAEAGEKRYDSTGIDRSATELQGGLKDDQIGEYVVTAFTTAADADLHAEVHKLTEELGITKLQHDLLSLKFEEKNVEARHMKAQLEQKDNEITAVRTELTDLQKKYEQLTDQQLWLTAELYETKLLKHEEINQLKSELEKYKEEKAQLLPFETPHASYESDESADEPMHGAEKAELMVDQQKDENEIDLRADEQTTNTISDTAKGNETTPHPNSQHMDSERSFSDENESPTESENYVVLPEELDEKIEQLCRDLGVNGVKILQDPYEWQKVVVLAPEATSKLTKPLKDLLKNNPQFSGFEVEPHDYDGYNKTKQLDWQRTLHFDRKTTTAGFATCELIALADTDPQRVFVVGPAHMMFCEEANEKFQTEKCDIDKIREMIQGAPPLRTVAIRSDHDTEVEIHPTPMIAYRYSYKRKSHPPNHHKLYTNDCVLFEFDAAKAQGVQRDLSDANKLRYEELREVTTTDQLQGEHTRRLHIAVKGYRGRLYHRVNINKDIAECKGVHLTFVLTSKDEDGNYHTLSEGDSGSIVYFVGEEIDGNERHQPWGMLIQSAILPVLNIGVYGAIALNQAFRDIEEDYELSSEKLQLYQPPNEEATASAVHDMPVDGNRSGGPVPSNPTGYNATQTDNTSSMSSNQCAVAIAQACSAETVSSSLPSSNTPCSSTEQANGNRSLPSDEDYLVPQQATSSVSPDNSDSDCIN